MCRKGENIRNARTGAGEARYIKYRDPEEKSTTVPLWQNIWRSKGQAKQKNCRIARLWISGAKYWHF